MKYEKFESDCYNLYTIKTDKFKNCHMEVVFRSECSKDNITYNALLFDILMESTKEYPRRLLLARKEQDLYNLNLYATNSRVGGVLLSNVIADFLDPKYMDTTTLEEIIKLVFESIFNPNVEGDAFDEKTFEIVKNRLTNEIEGLKEDVKQESILNALSLLDNDENRGLNMSGDIDVLKEITPKKLYKYYQNVLENSLVDVYIIGNLDMEEVNKLVRKYSKFNSIKTHKLSLYLNEIKQKKCKDVQEENNIKQMNMVQVYSLNNLDNFERDYVIPVFNLLWGSASLESKLYKKVRLDNALCYNISTFYQKYDGTIILHTAIDKENYSKAIKLIKSCLVDMEKGNITDAELDNVINILINSLNLIYDSPGKLIDNYLFRNIANLEEIDDRIEEFKKVTIKDLINVSHKIKLCINYRIGK